MPRRLRRLARLVSVVSIIVPSLLAVRAHAQATPAGSGSSGDGLSVFFLGTRTKTGFLGWNDSITAGVNLAMRPFHGLEPALELRGTYPVHSASTAANEMNFLGGPVLRRRFNRVEPYTNILFGYGRADYPDNYIYNTYDYVRSSGFIYSPGGGVDLFLTPRLSLKADLQYQHWNIPVVASGEAWARALSLGATYRFNSAGLHHHKDKLDPNDPSWHKLSEDYPSTRR